MTLFLILSSLFVIPAFVVSLALCSKNGFPEDNFMGFIILIIISIWIFSFINICFNNLEYKLEKQDNGSTTWVLHGK